MVNGTGSLCSMKPYLQPFDHFFTLITPWHKVIHDEDTGEKRGETSNEGCRWKESGVGAPDFSSRQDPR
jgi:hypothetical protein